MLGFVVIREMLKTREKQDTQVSVVRTSPLAQPLPLGFGETRKGQARDESNSQAIAA